MIINNKLLVLNYLKIIYNCSDCFFLPQKIFFYKWLSKSYIYFNIKKKTTIVLVNKNYILYLNSKFRNKYYVTDILSFPFKLNIYIKNFKNNYLGDIIICPLVVLERSLKNSINYFFYFSYLVIHGLLHILGFEHDGYLNFKIMRNLEYLFLFEVKKIYFYEHLLINKFYE